MVQPDHAIALAEQHVREAEERVARQTSIARRLDEAGHGWAADEARTMLAATRASLNMARGHLVFLRMLLDAGRDL